MIALHSTISILLAMFVEIQFRNGKNDNFTLHQHLHTQLALSHTCAYNYSYYMIDISVVTRHMRCTRSVAGETEGRIVVNHLATCDARVRSGVVNVLCACDARGVSDTHYANEPERMDIAGDLPQTEQ